MWRTETEVGPSKRNQYHTQKDTSRVDTGRPLMPANPSTEMHEEEASTSQTGWLCSRRKSTRCRAKKGSKQAGDAGTHKHTYCSSSDKDGQRTERDSECVVGHNHLIDTVTLTEDSDSTKQKGCPLTMNSLKCSRADTMGHLSKTQTEIPSRQNSVETRRLREGAVCLPNAYHSIAGWLEAESQLQFAGSLAIKSKQSSAFEYEKGVEECVNNQERSSVAQGGSSQTAWSELPCRSAENVGKFTKIDMPQPAVDCQPIGMTCPGGATYNSFSRAGRRHSNAEHGDVDPQERRHTGLDRQRVEVPVVRDSCQQSVHKSTAKGDDYRHQSDSSTPDVCALTRDTLINLGQDAVVECVVPPCYRDTPRLTAGPPPVESTENNQSLAESGNLPIETDVSHNCVLQTSLLGTKAARSDTCKEGHPIGIEHHHEAMTCLSANTDFSRPGLDCHGINISENTRYPWHFPVPTEYQRAHVEDQREKTGGQVKADFPRTEVAYQCVGELDNTRLESERKQKEHEYLHRETQSLVTEIKYYRTHTADNRLPRAEIADAEHRQADNRLEKIQCSMSDCTVLRALHMPPDDVILQTDTISNQSIGYDAVALNNCQHSGGCVHSNAVENLVNKSDDNDITCLVAEDGSAAQQPATSHDPWSWVGFDDLCHLHARNECVRLALDGTVTSDDTWFTHGGVPLAACCDCDSTVEIVLGACTEVCESHHLDVPTSATPVVAASRHANKIPAKRPRAKSSNVPGEKPAKRQRRLRKKHRYMDVFHPYAKMAAASDSTLPADAPCADEISQVTCQRGSDDACGSSMPPPSGRSAHGCARRFKLRIRLLSGRSRGAEARKRRQEQEDVVMQHSESD